MCTGVRKGGGNVRFVVKNLTSYFFLETGDKGNLSRLRGLRNLIERENRDLTLH